MEEQQTKSSGLGRKMAIQRITNKRIIKHDTNSPNFKPLPKVEEQVDGNLKENFEEDKVDQNPVKSEVTIGKVLTKKDKLKALRIRERRRNGDKV